MRIIIVGGGTAGWMTAAYLSRNLPRTKITVIDKEHGTPIGVGEGTVLDFFGFMRDCGFEFNDWFTNIDATFKAGILFSNWQKEGSKIWHPFFANLHLNHLNMDIWEILAYKNNLDYKEYACMLYDSAVNHNLVDLHETGIYSFHVDAGKLVTYIQNKCSSTVEIIKKEVVTINKNEDGEITSLELIDCSIETADLYIDCTGFRSLLKKQKKVDINNRLFCNTAVAGRVNFQNYEQEVRPYVICDAVEHGWIWQIPTQSRIGSGLVFNRDVTDTDLAKEFLCNYWNGRLKKENLKVIDWTPYYIENFWEKNIVSIGLSAGFVEPLESTGISLIIKGVVELENRLRLGLVLENDKPLYNTIIKNYFENVIDFVNMHYSSSTNTGIFWDHVRAKFQPSPTQKFIEKIINDHNFRHSISRKFDPNSFTMFQIPNWICLMVQYGFNLLSDGNKDMQFHAELALEKFYKDEQVRKYRCTPHVNLIEYYKNNGQ